MKANITKSSLNRLLEFNSSSVELDDDTKYYGTGEYEQMLLKEENTVFKLSYLTLFRWK
jgi:hypothetical protein